MRRFLIDGTVFEQPLTGVAKATLGLYQGLVEIDNALEITIAHCQSLHGEIPAAIKTIQLPASTAKLWRTSVLPLHVSRCNYDVVHFPWNSGIPANLPRQVLKVLTLHDVLPLIIPNYYRNPLRKIRYKASVGNSLRRADCVITDSEFSRQQIRELFQPQADPTVVYPSSPLNLKKTLDAETQKAIFFLFCGGYDKRKGIELLLETFIALWQRRGFQIPLWLAGTIKEYSPRLSTLLAQARQLGAIKELGYVADVELMHLYQNAMALIYPSRYEGFGLPPLEAMSLGCPVVTYPLTSLPEVCGEAVLYIDPDREDSLQNLILEVAHDKFLREKLAELGRHQAAKFSWQASAQLFLEAIRRASDN